VHANGRVATGAERQECTDTVVLDMRSVERLVTAFLRGNPVRHYMMLEFTGAVHCSLFTVLDKLSHVRSRSLLPSQFHAAHAELQTCVRQKETKSKSYYSVRQNFAVTLSDNFLLVFSVQLP